jgi:hypothetical protein
MREFANSSEATPSPVGKRRVLFPEQPHPSLRTEREFWSVGERAIPSFICSPWDFYENFIELHKWEFLVLCNDRSTVRLIKHFDDVCSYSTDSVGSVSSLAELEWFPLLGIKH